MTRDQESIVAELAVAYVASTKARAAQKRARAVELQRYREEVADFYPAEGEHGTIRNDGVEAAMAAYKVANAVVRLSRSRLTRAVKRFAA